MNQWLLPDIKAVSDQENSEILGKALAYAYRTHPWLKTEIMRYLSNEGVEPPGVDETVFVTYRRADDKPCFGEYAFMTSYDGLDEEESAIVEERWMLECKRIIPQPQEPDDEFEHLYEEDEEGVRKFKEQ